MFKPLSSNRPSTRPTRRLWTQSGLQRINVRSIRLSTVFFCRVTVCIPELRARILAHRIAAGNRERRRFSTTEKGHQRNRHRVPASVKNRGHQRERLAITTTRQAAESTPEHNQDSHQGGSRFWYNRSGLQIDVETSHITQGMCDRRADSHGIISGEFCH